MGIIYKILLRKNLWTTNSFLKNEIIETNIMSMIALTKNDDYHFSTKIGNNSHNTTFKKSLHNYGNLLNWKYNTSIEYIIEKEPKLYLNCKQAHDRLIGREGAKIYWPEKCVSFANGQTQYLKLVMKSVKIHLKSSPSEVLIKLLPQNNKENVQLRIN